MDQISNDLNSVQLCLGQLRSEYRGAESKYAKFSCAVESLGPREI